MARTNLSGRIDQMIWAFRESDHRREDVRAIADEVQQLEDAAAAYLALSTAREPDASKSDYPIVKRRLELLLKIHG